MARRTSIVVDDALLEEAQQALGTRGLKETVYAALNEAIRSRRRKQLLARLAIGTDSMTTLFAKRGPSGDISD